MIRSLTNFGGHHLEQSEETDDYVQWMSQRELLHDAGQNSRPLNPDEVRLGTQPTVDQVAEEVKPPAVKPKKRAKKDPSLSKAHADDLKKRNITTPNNQ